LANSFTMDTLNESCIRSLCHNPLTIGTLKSPLINVRNDEGKRIAKQ